jgi:hypothetical protein
LPVVHNSVNVVFGVAEGAKRDPRGYGVPGLVKFAKSLFATGFDGIVVIASDALELISRDLQRIFGDKRIFVFDIAQYRVGRLKDLHAKELRYHLYREWAMRFTNESTRIMLTDVRDVYFQENPFSDVYFTNVPDDTNLYLFEESEKKTLGTSEHCGKWIDTCFGAQVTERLYDKKIICSGTSMGSPQGIVGYTTVMLNEMASPQSLKKCHSPLHDQAFHNVLYYDGVFEKEFENLNIHVFQQGDGPANNIGISPVYKNFIQGDTVLNRNGIPSALVHQYDRHPSLIQKARSLMKE